MLKVPMGSFQVVGSDGKAYTINVFRYEVQRGDAIESGGPSDDPADWHYFTDRGNGYVKRVGKGSYHMTDDPSFTFTSSDPSAI